MSTTRTAGPVCLWARAGSQRAALPAPVAGASAARLSGAIGAGSTAKAPPQLPGQLRAPNPQVLAAAAIGLTERRELRPGDPRLGPRLPPQDASLHWLFQLNVVASRPHGKARPERSGEQLPAPSPSAGGRDCPDDVADAAADVGPDGGAGITYDAGDCSGSVRGVRLGDVPGDVRRCRGRGVLAGSG
jgi:hypothetical protein